MSESFADDIEYLGFCRICDSTENLEIIFDYEKITIYMLRAVGLSPIEVDDCLTRYLCRECIKELTKIYNFKLLYEATYRKFKEKHEEIKRRTAPTVASIVRSSRTTDISQLKSSAQSEITSAFNNDFSLICNKEVEEINHAEQQKHTSETKTINRPQDEFPDFISHPCQPWVKEYEIFIKQKIQDASSKKPVYQNCDKLYSTLDDIPSTIKLVEPKQYSCKERGKCLKGPKSLKSHELSHWHPNAFKCDECDKSYSRESHLKAHKLLHSNPHVYKCKICGQSYTLIHAFRKHKASHKRVYKCDVCQKSDISEAQIKKHESLNSIDLYRCEECDKSLSQVETYNSHEALQMNSRASQNEQCGMLSKNESTSNPNFDMFDDCGFRKRDDQCGKSFNQISSYRNHKALHLNPDLHMCKICGMSFKKSHLMRLHQKLHRNPNLVKGKICVQTNARQSDLKEHKALHINPFLYKCDECDKFFNRRRALLVHKVIHLQQNHTCEHCGRLFKDMRSYRFHKQLHLNPDLFKCHECGKSFSNYYRLKNHKALHLNPDLYKCDECGKQYCSFQKLKQHNLLHKNLDLYKCDKCGISYSRSDNFKKHQAWHVNTNLRKAGNVIHLQQKHTCEDCGKLFKDRRAYMFHKQRHLNPDMFKCHECGKSFSDSYRLKNHKALHLNPDLYKCDECGKRYCSHQKLKQHKFLTHKSRLI